MEFGNFLEFIYFSSLAISVNFPNQLVTVICNLVLKDKAPSRNGSMLIIVFCSTGKNVIVQNLKFI